MARIHAITVANLMSEATALHMRRPVINARVFSAQEVTATAETWFHWEQQQGSWQRRWQMSTEEEDAKEATKAESI